MQQVKDDVEGLKDETYLGDEFASFRKFGVVGDSLSVGYMTDSNNVVNQRNLPYSWGQVLARKNAQVCLNFGKSGITTTTWWTDSVCKDLLVLSENQCQAYIVGIGTNDVINESFPIGSMSDIDWSDYNNNANSFYGHYARILQLIRSVAPKAIIFVLTLPYPRADAAKNTAIRNICADAHLSSNVFLADLQADYNGLFKTIGDRYANDHHFTAAGYAAIAITLGVIISETIRKNSSVNAIKDIGFIPYGNNDVID
jgi:lysophospholipase L1-like esterase